MKTNIKIALLLLAIGITLSATANINNTKELFGTYEAPTYTFQSTSTMVLSGSRYSSTTASIDGIYTASSISTPSGPRKAGAINGEDDGDLPLGDGTWILMLLAVGYAGVITWKRRIVKS